MLEFAQKTASTDQSNAPIIAAVIAGLLAIFANTALRFWDSRQTAAERKTRALESYIADINVHAYVAWQYKGIFDVAGEDREPLNVALAQIEDATNAGNVARLRELVKKYGTLEELKVASEHVESERQMLDTTRERNSAAMIASHVRMTLAFDDPVVDALEISFGQVDAPQQESVDKFTQQETLLLGRAKIEISATKSIGPRALAYRYRLRKYKRAMKKATDAV